NFFHNPIDDFVLGQRCGINYNRVARDRQRPDRAAGIAMVARDDAAENLVVIDDFAARPQLRNATPGPPLRRGLELALHIGIGEDHRALIAPLGYQAAKLLADFALLLHEHLAD